MWLRMPRKSMLVAAVLVGSGMLVKPASAQHERRSSECRYVALQAANGKYVSAERGFAIGSSGLELEGMLRARASSIGPWETFYHCRTIDREGQISHPDTLEAQKSQTEDERFGLVSAEMRYKNEYAGVLRARPGTTADTSPTIGPWEEFKVEPPKCRDCTVTIWSSNGRYVSAELGYDLNDPRYGMLRARSFQIGPWERFTLVQLN